MPTHHPNQELARRLLPIAAYVRENSLEDGQLAQAAVRGLAEYLGLDIVVTDPNPEQKLEDLAGAYLDLLGRLAEHPDPEVRAALPGVVYELVLGAMRALREMYGRERDGVQPAITSDRGSLGIRPS